MNFTYQKEILLILTTIMVVIVAFPYAQQALDKKPELNSELWLLGQQCTADSYPFNIKSNQSYTVFLCVKNNLGGTVEYMVQAQFFNATQQVIGASVSSIYSNIATVKDGETWNLPITFSIDYTFNETTLNVDLNSISINDVVTNISDVSVAWDPDTGGRFSYLYFDLWIYDNDAKEFKNCGCSVNLRLNLTTS